MLPLKKTVRSGAIKLAFKTAAYKRLIPPRQIDQLSFRPADSRCHHCDLSQLTRHTYPLETYLPLITHTLLTYKHPLASSVTAKSDSRLH